LLLLELSGGKQPAQGVGQLSGTAEKLGAVARGRAELGNELIDLVERVHRFCRRQTAGGVVAQRRSVAAYARYEDGERLGEVKWRWHGPRLFVEVAKRLFAGRPGRRYPLRIGGRHLGRWHSLLIGCCRLGRWRSLCIRRCHLGGRSPLRPWS
jgi:hypothetical protein